MHIVYDGLSKFLSISRCKLSELIVCCVIKRIRKNERENWNLSVGFVIFMCKLFSEPLSSISILPAVQETNLWHRWWLRTNWLSAWAAFWISIFQPWRINHFPIGSMHFHFEGFKIIFNKKLIVEAILFILFFFSFTHSNIRPIRHMIMTTLYAVLFMKICSMMMIAYHYWKLSKGASMIETQRLK